MEVIERICALNMIMKAIIIVGITIVLSIIIVTISMLVECSINSINFLYIFEEGFELNTIENLG